MLVNRSDNLYRFSIIEFDETIRVEVTVFTVFQLQLQYHATFTIQYTVM